MILWICTVIILITANLVVSHRLFRRVEFTLGQKMLQGLLVWLLPGFGALFVHMFRILELDVADALAPTDAPAHQTYFLDFSHGDCDGGGD